MDDDYPEKKQEETTMAQKIDPKPIEPVEIITPPPAVPPVQPQLSTGDERTWGMLAHLSVLLNLVTGMGGPIAALIIYLVYKDRSRIVAYHSLQAFVFQLICWVGGGAVAGVMWALSGILSAVLIGLLLMPIACLFSLLPLGGLVYGIVGAVQVSQGKDFKYLWVGDWMRGTLTGE
jgi:uncharacterized Tic20 family protein